MRLIALLLLTTLLLTSCSHHQWLTGTYPTATALQQDLAWKTTLDSRYRPDPEMLRALAAADSFETRVFLSSWCHDSKREVPRFLSFVDKLPTTVVEYVALDTTRLVPSGYKEPYGIRATPTFIFYRGGKELGRIVEKPTGRLEQHILRIVKGTESR